MCSVMFDCLSLLWVSYAHPLSPSSFVHYLLASASRQIFRSAINRKQFRAADTTAGLAERGEWIGGPPTHTPILLSQWATPSSHPSRSLSSSLTHLPASETSHCVMMKCGSAALTSHQRDLLLVILKVKVYLTHSSLNAYFFTTYLRQCPSIPSLPPFNGISVGITSFYLIRVEITSPGTY